MSQKRTHVAKLASDQAKGAGVAFVHIDSHSPKRLQLSLVYQHQSLGYKDEKFFELRSILFEVFEDIRRREEEDEKLSPGEADLSFAEFEGFEEIRKIVSGEVVL